MEFGASVIAGITVAVASVLFTDLVRELRERHRERIRRRNILSGLALELKLNLDVVHDMRALLQRAALDAALPVLADVEHLYFHAIRVNHWIETYNAWIGISNYFDAQPVPGYKHKLKSGQAVNLTGINPDDVIIRPAVPENLASNAESALRAAQQAIAESLTPVPAWWKFWA